MQQQQWQYQQLEQQPNNQQQRQQPQPQPQQQQQAQPQQQNSQQQQQAVQQTNQTLPYQSQQIVQQCDQINIKPTTTNQTQQQQSIWKEAQLSPYNKEIPSARWGHSFVKANNDLLYLFGGYAESNYMNDSWTFDLNTCSWKALTNQGGIIPEKRSNHSGCYLEKSNKILIFGGGGKEKKRFNDIHLLDIEMNSWEQLMPFYTETVTPRTYHTANLFFDSYVAIFGGEGVGDLNDLCILCLQPFPQWIVLQGQGRSPPKRRFHSSAVVKNKLYILGGCFSNYRCHDDIWELNLGEYLLDSSKILEWKQIMHYNHVFQPRWGQCSQVYDDKVYIFGGRNLKDLNETIIFDPSKSSDCLIKIDQTSPNPRRRGAAVVVGSSIIVFGGFDGIYYNDIHYLNITQTECDQQVKIENEQHFNYLQSVMYSQQNYDLEIIFSSFKVGIHKIIVVERMNNIRNQQFLDRIEMADTLNLTHRHFEQRFFINTIVQYMYSGVFDYRQIRNQKDLNQLQEFAQEIQLFTLLDALNQNEQWIRSEIQSTLVQRFNTYYFQRYFRCKPKQKKLIYMVNKKNQDISENNSMNNNNNNNLVSINNSHNNSNTTYDPQFIIVNDQIWFEDNEIFYQYSDVTFQCEGKQIRANKFLLSTQSTYFSTIFELEFMEKTETIINIEITSYHIFKIILNFIYYHKIILPTYFQISDWLNLIQAAKYFQITHIQEVCELELIKVVNNDNIVSLYYSSILYNCPKLRLICSQFYALKLNEWNIDAHENSMQDSILEEMKIEGERTNQMLKFQIKQNEIEEQQSKENNKNNNGQEEIEIEQDHKQLYQNLYTFISEQQNWENQDQIIQRLKIRNQSQNNINNHKLQQQSLHTCSHNNKILSEFNNYICNCHNHSSPSTNSTNSNNSNNEFYFSQIYHPNQIIGSTSFISNQSINHNHINNNTNNQNSTPSSVNYLNNHSLSSDKQNSTSSQSSHSSIHNHNNNNKNQSPLFQTQDFIVYSQQQKKQQQSCQSQQQQGRYIINKNINRRQEADENITQEILEQKEIKENSICLSGRSRDSITDVLLVNPTSVTTPSHHKLIHPNFINHHDSSEDYIDHLNQNAMIDETSNYQTNTDYSL